MLPFIFGSRRIEIRDDSSGSPTLNDSRSTECVHLPVWLLSDDRLLFLRSHGASAREFIIRRRRSRIFWRYLRRLKMGFERRCMGLKTVMVHSSYDRPDLATFLIRTQIQFTIRLLLVRLRVCRYRL